MHFFIALAIGGAQPNVAIKRGCYVFVVCGFWGNGNSLRMSFRTTVIKDVFGLGYNDKLNGIFHKASNVKSGITGITLALLYTGGGGGGGGGGGIPPAGGGGGGGTPMDGGGGGGGGGEPMSLIGVMGVLLAVVVVFMVLGLDGVVCAKLVVRDKGVDVMMMLARVKSSLSGAA